jgi:hypothetical protein
LERLAQELLEHESLDGAEVYATIREMTGKDLHPKLPEPKTAKLQREGHGDEAEMEASDPGPSEEDADEPLDATPGQESPPSDSRPSAE